MDENPNIKIVHNKAADLAGRPRQLLREARQGRPRRHRGRRGRLVHRGDAVLRPARRGARQRQGPLARLEGSRRDRRRRPPHRLRHRHRPAGASATAPTCSRPPACRADPTRSPRCSTATGSNYFDVADQYKAATGKPMIDSANSVSPGHGQPDRVRLRGARRHRHRDREPRGRGRATTRSSSAPSRTRPTPASGATTGTRRWPTASSRPCCARAGCSASSRATRPSVTGWDVANVFPERRRQLGRLVPDRSGQRRERRGGARARRLADRCRAAGQDVRQRRARTRARSRRSRAPRRSPTRRTRTSTTRRPARSSRSVPRPSRSNTYKSVDYFKYNQALQDAITRVFDGTRRPADRVGHLRRRGRSILID